MTSIEQVLNNKFDRVTMGHRCDICFQTRPCRQRCRTCRTNNICNQCYTMCMEVNQPCPFCRQPYLDVPTSGLTGPARLSQEVLTNALDNLLPETNTPGNIMLFRNSINHTVKIIASHADPQSNTPVGISVVSNNRGQV